MEGKFEIVARAKVLRDECPREDEVAHFALLEATKFDSLKLTGRRVHLQVSLGQYSIRVGREEQLRVRQVF